MKRTSFKARRRRGYTLIEVLVAFGIFSVLGAMILSLTIGVSRSLFDTEGKGKVDRSFRTTSSSLTRLLSTCDFTYVVTSPDARDPVTDVLAPGQSGDMLVAVFYENPSQIRNGRMDTKVARIVGVCRVKRAKGMHIPTLPSQASGTAVAAVSKKVSDDYEGGAVYLFDSARHDWGVKFPATSDETPKSVLKLLPSAAEIPSFTPLADCVISVDDSGRVFKNNEKGTGAVMLSRIRSGKPGQYVSSAYVFSVSSRNL